jgi:hypothetical protein
MNYASNISTEELNKELQSVHTLIARAYDHNRTLAKQAESQNLALRHMSDAVTAANASAGGFLATQGFAYAPPAGQNNVLRVHGISFWDAPLYMNGTSLQNGSLVIADKGSESRRVPFQEDGSLSNMVSIGLSKVTTNDNTVKWILEEDKFWCIRVKADDLGDTDGTRATIDIHITLPPTVKPEINYILVDNLFPSGISYEVDWFDMSTQIHSLASSKSQFFPIDGRRFGGKLILRLTSTIKEVDNGDTYFVFGLKQLSLGYKNYLSAGYAVNKIDLTHTSGNELTIHTLRASYATPNVPVNLKDAIQFTISDAINSNGTNLAGNILYSSVGQPFPLQPNAADIVISSCPDTIYMRTDLYNNSASPQVSGLYFEYSGA